jgi:hypothetical protein
VARLTTLEYCTTICGAKCCKVYHEQEVLCECPKLADDRSCSIYKERFEQNQPYSFARLVPHRTGLKVIQANCGKIQEIIQKDDLPDWILKQCCFANPKLLEVKDAKKQTQRGGKKG